MLLVHQKKNNLKRWEVAWMWIPHFLAADLNLVKHVDEVMSDEFKGVKLPRTDEPILYHQELMKVGRKMHDRVIDLVLEKYPMKGLREYLEAALQVDPEMKP